MLLNTVIKTGFYFNKFTYLRITHSGCITHSYTLSLTYAGRQPAKALFWMHIGIKMSVFVLTWRIQQPLVLLRAYYCLSWWLQLRWARNGEIINLYLFRTDSMILWKILNMILKKKKEKTNKHTKNKKGIVQNSVWLSQKLERESSGCRCNLTWRTPCRNIRRKTHMLVERCSQMQSALQAGSSDLL